LSKSSEPSTPEEPDLQFGIARKRSFLLILFAGILLISSGLFFLRLEHSINGTGTLYAATEWYVYSPRDEIIQSIPARINQEVAAGDLLYQFDDSDLRLSLIQRREQLLAIDAESKDLDWQIRIAGLIPDRPELMTADQRLELLGQIREIQQAMTNSLSGLADQQAIRSLEYFRQQVENLRTQIQTLDAEYWIEWKQQGLQQIEVDRIEARKFSLSAQRLHIEDEIAFLEDQLQRYRVMAPISGTVVEMYVRHQGMKPPAGERLAKIAVLDGRYRVRTYLPQRNIDLVHEGLPTRMASKVFNSTMEGYIYGKVSRVSRDASRDVRSPNGDPLYEIWIEVEDTPHPLVLGSKVEVEVLLGQISLMNLFFQKPAEERSSLNSPASSHD